MVLKQTKKDCPWGQKANFLFSFVWSFVGLFAHSFHLSHFNRFLELWCQNCMTMDSYFTPRYGFKNSEEDIWGRWAPKDKFTGRRSLQHGHKGESSASQTHFFKGTFWDLNTSSGGCPKFHRHCLGEKPVVLVLPPIVSLTWTACFSLVGVLLLGQKGLESSGPRNTRKCRHSSSVSSRVVSKSYVVLFDYIRNFSEKRVVRKSTQIRSLTRQYLLLLWLCYSSFLYSSLECFPKEKSKQKYIKQRLKRQ